MKCSSRIKYNITFGNIVTAGQEQDPSVVKKGNSPQEALN